MRFARAQQWPEMTRNPLERMREGERDVNVSWSWRRSCWLPRTAKLGLCPALDPEPHSSLALPLFPQVFPRSGVSVCTALRCECVWLLVVCGLCVCNHGHEGGATCVIVWECVIWYAYMCHQAVTTRRSEHVWVLLVCVHVCL